MLMLFRNPMFGKAEARQDPSFKWLVKQGHLSARLGTLDLGEPSATLLSSMLAYLESDRPCLETVAKMLQSHNAHSRYAQDMYIYEFSQKEISLGME